MIALPALNKENFLFVCGLFFFFFFFFSTCRAIASREGIAQCVKGKHIRCEMRLRKVTKTVGETKGGAGKRDDRIILILNRSLLPAF